MILSVKFGGFKQAVSGGKGRSTGLAGQDGEAGSGGGPGGRDWGVGGGERGRDVSKQDTAVRR